MPNAPISDTTPISQFLVTLDAVEKAAGVKVLQSMVTFNDDTSSNLPPLHFLPFFSFHPLLIVLTYFQFGRISAF